MTSHHVEVVDAATLNPSAADLHPSSPRSRSVPADVGQAAVSSWLSSLLVGQTRDPTSGHNPKLLGLPTFQIDPTAVSSHGISHVYVGSNDGGHVVDATPDDGRNLPAATGGLDFTPIHISLQNAGSGAPRVQELQLGPAGAAVVQDPQMLATAAIRQQSVIDGPPVVFAGHSLERQIPDGSTVVQGSARMATAQDAVVDAARPLLASPQRTDDGSHQLHLLVQDIHGVSNKLALKLEHDRVGGVQAGQQRREQARVVPQFGGLVAGRADAMTMEQAHALHSARAQVMQQAQQQQVLQQVAPAPKTRWKPNAAQLCLLERHFSSGYTKPTPELYAAVKGAGEAREAQVSVWLKNRLARSKRQANKMTCVRWRGHWDGQSFRPTSEAMTIETAPDTRNNAASDGDNATSNVEANGQKRSRMEGEDESSEDFDKISEAMLGEVATALTAIDADELSNLVKDVCGARKVCCYGVGRERLVMQALVMRLSHMGLQAWMVGEANTPAVGTDDILLASAGPSFYNTVNAICLAAIRAGTKVVAFTGHQTAPLPFADRVVRIPAHPVNLSLSKIPQNETADGDALDKVMPLGSGFEATLWMMFECLCVMIQKKLGVKESEMLARHTNLELDMERSMKG